jgi:hypothetical protein
VWQIAKSQEQRTKNQEQRTKNQDANTREQGSVSHVVFAHFQADKCDDIVFTAYRPEMPYDVLTENMVGCGNATKDDISVVWFDAGNFHTPWQPNEDIILIIEIHINGQTYCGVIDFMLDETVDVQNIARITLDPLPEPTLANSNAHWTELENKNIIGYSLYATDQRLNQTIINTTTYPTDQEVFLRPVIRGGFETIYSSQGCQSRPDEQNASAFSFTTQPNPFSNLMNISFAVGSKQYAVGSIIIFDVSGRVVKTLLPHQRLKSNAQSLTWNATDDQGRTVPSGVYFIRFKTDEKLMQEKVLLIK